MSKIHQVTIPRSAYAEFQHFLAEPSKPTQQNFYVMLAMLVVQTIGHVRLFQTKEDELPTVLEWSTNAGTKTENFLWTPMNQTAEVELFRQVLQKSSSHRSTGSVDLFIELSVDPSDKSLSIDVTTQPVLEGEDVTAMAAAPPTDAQPTIDEYRVRFDDIYLTAAEAAELLHVDKSTVTRRIKNNKLIGFRLFKNVLRIPKDQFKDGDVIDGVADLLSLFKSRSADDSTFVDHRAAWAFLGSKIYLGEAAPRPIDRLRANPFDKPVTKLLEELTLAKQSLDYGDHI